MRDWRASTHRLRRWRPGFGIVSFRGGLQSFPLPLLHELLVFRGAGPWRGIGGHAAGPLRDGIAHSGRESFVDGSASAEAARKRDGKGDGEMAGTDGHLLEVAALSGEFFVGRRRSVPPMDPACPRRRSSRLFQPNVSVALIKLCLLAALGIMMPQSAQ